MNAISLKSLVWKLSLLVLVTALSGLTARAQLSTATLFGTITDSTGAAIPHAIVTLVQTDTNFTRSSTTKDDGSYREEFLPIGPYKVTGRSSRLQDAGAYRNRALGHAERGTCTCA